MNTLIELAAIASLIAVIVVETQTSTAQGASIFDILKVNALNTHLDNVVNKIDMTSTLVSACADLDERLSACVRFFENEDKHLKAAFKESSADIQEIMGFGFDANSTSENK